MPIIFINYLKDTFLNNLPRDLYSALNKLKTFTIITLALCEIPAICGFVLFFLWGINFDFYFLIGISLISEYKYFPRLSQWEEIISRAIGYQ